MEKLKENLWKLQNIKVKLFINQAESSWRTVNKQKGNKMEGESTESTHNTKVSDSAYSTSCSNSQSQRR